MQMNFKAIVELHKLSPSTPLLPLFEAIVNSIQSIEEVGIVDGKIDIQVVREIENTSLFAMSTGVWETYVSSFAVSDNGIGFNDKNYNSFDVYGSDHKSTIGCKGVGRISWLKAFSEVSIESTYSQDGILYDRNFNFSVKSERKLLYNGKSKKTQTGSVIKLNGYFSKYKNKCPKRLETLARDIMNHCFTYLALEACPQIIIRDERDTISINTLFNDNIKGRPQIFGFTINGRDFKLISAKNYAASDKKHLLHFCAHKREVNSENLSNHITALTGKLFNEDGDFVFAGYVIGSVLDDSINADRTDFSILRGIDAENESEDDMGDENKQTVIEGAKVSDDITKANIIKAAIPLISEYLKDEISQYSEEKKQQVESYVNTTNPRYRFLLKHDPNCIEQIRAFQDDEKLELELFRQEQSYKFRLKKEQKDFIRDDIDSIQDYKDYTQRCGEYLTRISDMGKSSLADYIMHRKVMLDILAKNLRYSDAEKQRYALEKEIHNIIFPMMTTSDDIDYSKHNLWIIDEKLAYHYYLASDKPISSYDVMDSNSDKEPDITIFESAFALTDEGGNSEVNNITIVEFKRPGRIDKECVDQAIGYIQDIRSGKRKDKHGQVLAEMTYKNVKFTCYILCDIPVQMTEFLEGRNFKKTPDGNSYYQYYDNLNAYLEVMPYKKMVNDSIKRSKILFDKLLCQ
jgi:hypothetical protein